MAVSIILTICTYRSNDSIPTVNDVPITTEAAVTSTAAPTEPPTEAVTLPPFELQNCTAAMLFCVENEEVLYGKNTEAHIYPASLTKLLTACTALKYVDSSEICTVGTELYLVQPGSSLCFISQGQQLTMHDLITGLLMSSGNDAAYTIAVTVARTVNHDTEMTDVQAVEFFCGLMNACAAELGMDNSHFANPDGWDDDRQYTTVSDLLILSQHVMDIPEILEIAGCNEKQVTIESGEDFFWQNSNRLLYPDSEFYYPDAAGLKTGSTLKAGYCLIALIKKNGYTYISVVTDCPDEDERYRTTLKLLSEYI